MLDRLLQWLGYESDDKKELRSQLTKILRFKPKSIDFYIQALTHKSAIDENESNLSSNERLEFLGDAILGSSVADYLYHNFPEADEGFLTQLRSKIVSRKYLNQLADKVSLDKIIISNIDSKQRINSVKGNAFEALIGAIYLDRGIDYAQKYILSLIKTGLIDVKKLSTVNENFKSQIIEYGQKNKIEVEFETVSEVGKGYDKQFIVEVIVGGESLGRGKGRSKKSAEQHAAKLAMDQLD